MKNEKETNWAFLDRSEVCWNELNPDFVKSFTINYFFEKK
jgi:hypothetical protein